MAVIGYIVVLYGYLADIFIFDIEISGFDLVGACLILIVTVSVTVWKLRQKLHQNAE